MTLAIPELRRGNDGEYDLSVVTVCRNALAGLQRTLGSVLWHKQHGRLRIEHVVVDGDSTDGSADFASQAAQRGEIECYISEPDSGIYDAMNKGIRLARGRVIYFLNCGDELLQVDLGDILRPLLEDECVSLAAPVRTYVDGGEMLRLPIYDDVFIYTPVCHQGYFVKTEVCEQVGGFDLTYRCIADFDFMCKVMLRYGGPRIEERVVASRVEDGFSHNCGHVFLPEYIALRSRYLNDILERSLRDKDFMYYAIGVITGSVAELVKWQAEFKKDGRETVRKLQEQCRALRKMVPGLSRKLSLWWYEKVLLAHMGQNGKPTEILCRCIKYAWASSLPPADCRYVRHGQMQGAHFRYLVRKRLLRCFGIGG